jgi:putative effector of murein hydrolase LrgA (UPF0299 family)
LNSSTATAAVIVLAALFFAGAFIGRCLLSIGLPLPVAQLATVAILLACATLILFWINNRGKPS